MEGQRISTHTEFRYTHEPPAAHAYTIHDSSQVCRHSGEKDSIPERRGGIKPLSGRGLGSKLLPPVPPHPVGKFGLNIRQTKVKVYSVGLNPPCPSLGCLVRLLSTREADMCRRPLEAHLRTSGNRLVHHRHDLTHEILSCTCGV